MRALLISSFAAALCASAGSTAVDTAGRAAVSVELGENAKGEMTFALSTSEIRAGSVLFAISNASTVLGHGFLIAPWARGPNSIPYDDKEEHVRESALQGLQGITEVAPGQKVTLRLTLAPGEYLAFCDQPGHYKAGMLHRLVVRP